jgi:hypothetical protein
MRFYKHRKIAVLFQNYFGSLFRILFLRSFAQQVFLDSGARIVVQPKIATKSVWNSIYVFVSDRFGRALWPFSRNKINVAFFTVQCSVLPASAQSSRRFQITIDDGECTRNSHYQLFVTAACNCDKTLHFVSSGAPARWSRNVQLITLNVAYKNMIIFIFLLVHSELCRKFNLIFLFCLLLLMLEKEEHNTWPLPPAIQSLSWKGHVLVDSGRFFSCFFSIENVVNNMYTSSLLLWVWVSANFICLFTRCLCITQSKTSAFATSAVTSVGVIFVRLTCKRKKYVEY